MTRFFVTPEVLINDELMLTGENAAHAKVLRLKAGENVLVCDGVGHECLCEIINAADLHLRVINRHHSTS